MPNRLLSLALPLVVLASSCLSHSTRPVPIPVDSTVHLELAETLPSAQGVLRLLLRTEREYGCLNTRIITALTRSPGSIQVAILGIQNPPVCAMAVGPATAGVDVGYLEPGEYQLRFVLNGAAIESRLLVTPDAYRIVGGNASGLIVDHSTLRRVPETMLWGWIGATDAADPAAVTSYLEALQALGVEPHVFATGRYSPVIESAGDVFFIDDHGGIVLGGALGFPRFQPYVFRFAGDPDRMIGLLKDLGRRYRGTVLAEVDTWNGAVLRSWVLAGPVPQTVASRSRGR